MAKRKIVFLENNTPLTTSLIVAKGTENQHESIIRLINEHKARFERWGQIHFTDLKSGNKKGDMRGRPTRVAILNEPQATFLITLLRNNEVVTAFKEDLVARFFDLREKLMEMRLSGELQRLEIREKSKVERKNFTDAIQRFNQRDFVDGDHNPQARARYSRLTAKTQMNTFGIPAGGRDTATGRDLAALLFAESAITNAMNHAYEDGNDFDQAEARRAVAVAKQVSALVNGELQLIA